MVAPFTKIVVDKKEEAKFRRRALKKYPLEYMEALWGRIRGDVLYVCLFVPFEHKATSAACSYTEEELDTHEEEAAEEKYIFLGTIHTHPDVDHGLFSEGDLFDSQDTQEVVMGICAIKPKSEGKNSRRRTIVEYWPTVRPLAVEHKDWDAQPATKKRSRSRTT